jgi:hypothetical protein
MIKQPFFHYIQTRKKLEKQLREAEVENKLTPSPALREKINVLNQQINDNDSEQQAFYGGGVID